MIDVILAFLLIFGLRIIVLMSVVFVVSEVLVDVAALVQWRRARHVRRAIRRAEAPPVLPVARIRRR